jgi:predicted Fe-S protein YdhL (DUF1289 family)
LVRNLRDHKHFRRYNKDGKGGARIMIEIVLSGMCKGCNRAELEIVDCISIEEGNSSIVVCRHEDACNRLKTQATERAKEDGDTDW